MIYGRTTILAEHIEEKELFFKAEMTRRQMLALEFKLRTSDIENEIKTNHYFNRIEKGKKFAQDDVVKWLRNAWNTERILGQNLNLIEESGLSIACQWAFPQAYYSTFGTLLAFYKSVGFTESSHTAVLRKFGQLVTENKMPQSISFHCKGTKQSIDYQQITKPVGYNAIYLDLNDKLSVDNQICQFLKSTREINLDDRAPEIIKSKNFLNASGALKKRLSAVEWGHVASSVGVTSLMDILYRKRIKANYQDIDVFTYEKLKGEEIIKSLMVVVDRFNLVTETYIAKALGREGYMDIVEKHLKRNGENQPLIERYNCSLQLIA